MEILFIALTTAGIAVLAFFVLAVLVNLGRSLRSTPQSAESTLRQEQTEISPPLNSSPQSAESTLRQEQTEISPPLNSSPQSAESTLRKEEPEISPHQHIWLAKEPIRIGILHSTSGPMASAEQGSVDAALLAVEEINVRGGILGRSVEAIVRDGASDPQKFAQGAASLIEVDQVASIFGCWLTPTRQAVKKIVEDADHLLWYPLLYEGYEAYGVKTLFTLVPCRTSKSSQLSTGGWKTKPHLPRNFTSLARTIISPSSPIGWCANIWKAAG